MGCNIKEAIRNLLLQLLDENMDVCCLCMKIVETCDKVRFEDEVIINFEVDSILRMRDVLSDVFGEAVIDQLSSLGIICQKCSSLAANSYKFIKESKQNAEYCAQIVEHLETVFNNTMPQLGEFKTLYLSLDLKPKLVTYQMFDILNVNSNVSNALQRYKKIAESNSQYHPERKVVNIKQEMDHKQKTTHMKIGRGKDIDTKPSICHKKENVVKFHPTLPVTKVYTCLECDLKFQSASILKKHKIQIHTNLMCSECGKQFKYPQSLKAHMDAHYSKYICQKCGRTYKTLTTMRLHYKNDVCQHSTRHSPATAKFTCDYCNKKYTQKMSLRVHIQYEHLNYKSHHCKWCKKKFWCKSRLDAHVIKHTKEKKFLCVTCDKKFVTKESLLYHTRIHTGERPYDCTHCDEKFLSASRRTGHIRSHHKDPNVQCENCHSEFNSHHYLLKHMRNCGQKSQGAAKVPFSITDTSKIQPSSPVNFEEVSAYEQVKTGKYENLLVKTPNRKRSAEAVQYVLQQNDQTELFVPLESNIEVYKKKSQLCNDIEIEIDLENEDSKMENNEAVLFQISDNSDDYAINVCENVEV